MGQLDGKVAFITGAARGQGRSHALRLAGAGANIIAVDICGPVDGLAYPAATEEDLAETVGKVEGLDRRIFAVKTDVRDMAALQNAVDKGVGEFGRLDIVVANAGVGTAVAPAHEFTEDDWQTMIDINLTGVWHTCKAAIPHLIEGGRGGAIVITSSVGGFRGYQNIGHYVSAKHGVVGLMRTLANELGPHRIRVNTVHPTQVDTVVIRNEKAYQLFCPDLENPTVDDFAAVSQGMHVLPTPWVEPIDISNAVLFLASDDARFITGATLPIDAGALVR